MDSSIVSYSALGGSLDTDPRGNSASSRLYIGGSGNTLGSAGPSIVSKYDTCRFLPGSMIRWLPNQGSTTSGRIWCCFVDNPEKARNMEIALFNYINGDGTLPAKDQLLFDIYRAQIQSNSSVLSFPVWQSHDIQVPQKVRRKRFDTNALASGDTDPIAVLNRCMQVGFFYISDGAPATTNIGSFQFFDKVDVEGMNSVVT